MIPGEQTTAHVYNLRPATTYHMRIVAENEVGTSQPSDVVTIITAEESKCSYHSNELTIVFIFNKLFNC